LAPKAHAAHCTKLAISFAWFKCHYPNVFYQVLLGGEDKEELMLCSDEDLEHKLSLLNDGIYDVQGKKDTIQLLLEARQRGYVPVAPDLPVRIE
jgi:DNA polymerase III alpha subunit (gram-positive type)